MSVVRVIASGFCPDENVVAFLGRASGGRGTADGSGLLQFDVRIPESADFGPQSFTLLGDQGTEGTLSVVVRRPASTPGNDAPAPPCVSNTGADIAEPPGAPFRPGQLLVIRGRAWCPFERVTLTVVVNNGPGIRRLALRNDITADAAGRFFERINLPRDLGGDSVVELEARGSNGGADDVSLPLPRRPR